MKDSLVPGLSVEHVYTMGPNKRVPDLYPESDLFVSMPGVFATGFMVGLLEWGALETLRGHLDEGWGSLGIDIRVDHTAPTVPGQTITVAATVTAVEGRRVSFDVSAHDGVDRIAQGTHQRMVVRWDRFVAKVDAKAARAGVPGLPPARKPKPPVPKPEDMSDAQWQAILDNEPTYVARLVTREPQPVTARQFSENIFGLPEKTELRDGMIGPFRDEGKLALLSNWGADDIVRLTGPGIWRAAIEAYEGQTGQAKTGEESSSDGNPA